MSKEAKENKKLTAHEQSPTPPTENVVMPGLFPTHFVL